MEASLPRRTAKAPLGTTRIMSPCLCPEGMYSTKPESSQLGIAVLFITCVPFMSEWCGPSSKSPFGSSPVFILFLVRDHEPKKKDVDVYVHTCKYCFNDMMKIYLYDYIYSMFLRLGILEFCI